MKSEFTKLAILGGVSLLSLTHTQGVLAADVEFSSTLHLDTESRWSSEDLEVGDAYLSAIQAIPGDGAIAVGYVGDQSLLVKWSQSGEVEWSRQISLGERNSLNAITTLDDGGFLAVGSVYIDEDEEDWIGAVNNGMLIKFDSEGTQQWMKTFSGDNDDLFKGVITTADGGVVVVGSSASSNAGFENNNGGSWTSSDAVIVKYNRAGEQQWIKNFGGENSDEFSSIEATSDGGFIVAGYTENSSGLRALAVYKFKTSGEEAWSYLADIDNNLGSEAYSVIETSDNGYLVSGSIQNRNENYYRRNDDALVIKLSNDGKVEWMETFGLNQDLMDEIAYASVELGDGSYLLSQYSSSSDFPLLVNIDADGTLLWEEEVTSVGAYGRISGLSISQEGALWASAYGRALGQEVVSPVMLKYLDLTVETSTPGDDNLGNSSDNAGNTTINGNIEGTVISFTVPTELSFLVNPNASEGERFVAPEFTVSNDSNSPLTLSVGTFEETTEFFTDVLGSRYQDSEWDKLGVKDSKQFALALNLEEGENWLVQTQLESLYAKTVQDTQSDMELGTIRPNSTANFNFSAKHGLAFKEALNPEYSITFIFDLFNE